MHWTILTPVTFSVLLLVCNSLSDRKLAREQRLFQRHAVLNAQTRPVRARQALAAEQRLPQQCGLTPAAPRLPADRLGQTRAFVPSCARQGTRRSFYTQHTHARTHIHIYMYYINTHVTIKQTHSPWCTSFEFHTMSPPDGMRTRLASRT